MLNRSRNFTGSGDSRFFSKDQAHQRGRIRQDDANSAHQDARGSPKYGARGGEVNGFNTSAQRGSRRKGTMVVPPSMDHAHAGQRHEAVNGTADNIFENGHGTANNNLQNGHGTANYPFENGHPGKDHQHDIKSNGFYKPFNGVTEVDGGHHLPNGNGLLANGGGGQFLANGTSTDMSSSVGSVREVIHGHSFTNGNSSQPYNGIGMQQKTVAAALGQEGCPNCEKMKHAVGILQNFAAKLNECLAECVNGVHEQHH